MLKKKKNKNIRNAFLWSNWSIFNTQVLHGAQKTATSPTVRGTGWWTTAETDNGIKGIDPQFAISSPFLASVKQLPRGDGFHLQKKWINGSCKEGVAVVVEWQWSGCPSTPEHPTTKPNDAFLWAGWRRQRRYWQCASRRGVAKGLGWTAERIERAETPCTLAYRLRNAHTHTYTQLEPWLQST